MFNFRLGLRRFFETAVVLQSQGEHFYNFVLNLLAQPALATAMVQYTSQLPSLRQSLAVHTQAESHVATLGNKVENEAQQLNEAAKEATGSYRIIFRPAFAGPPTVTASALRDPGDSSLVIAILEAVGPESADVYCAGLDNSVKNRAFNFIAVGPR